MRAFLGIVLMCSVAGAPVAAQAQAKPSKPIGAYPNTSLGISGLASSAKFCVASAAGNIHPIGWIREGCKVEIQD